MKKNYAIITFLTFVFAMSAQVSINEDFNAPELLDSIQSKNKAAITDNVVFRANGAKADGASTKIVSHEGMDGLASQMLNYSYDALLCVPTNTGIVIPMSPDTTKDLVVSMDILIDEFMNGDNNNFSEGGVFGNGRFLKLALGTAKYGVWSAYTSTYTTTAANYQTWMTFTQTIAASDLATYVKTNAVEGTTDISLNVCLGYNSTPKVAAENAIYAYSIDMYIDNVSLVQEGTATAIAELPESAIKIITKPGAIEVINALGQEGVISIYAITGRKVKEVALQSVGNTISLERGMYIVATSIDGRVSTQKVIL